MSKMIEYDYDYNEFDESAEYCDDQYGILESDPDTIRIARQEVFYQNEDTCDYLEFHNAIHEPDSRNFLGLIPLPSFLDKENFDWDNADIPIREPMRYFTYYMNEMYHRNCELMHENSRHYRSFRRFKRNRK